MSVVGAEIAPVAPPPEPEALFEKNLALAHSMVARHIRIPIGIDPDDVYQAARIALWSACRSYRPGRASFSTWAAKVVRWRVVHFLRCRRHQALRQAPLLRSKSGEQRDSLAQVAAPAQPGAWLAREAKEQVRDLLRLLPARERRVMDLLYGLGGEAPVTQEGIAALLGVAHQRISQIVERALRRMRRAAERRGLGGAA